LEETHHEALMKAELENIPELYWHIFKT